LDLLESKNKAFDCDLFGEKKLVLQEEAFLYDRHLLAHLESGD
jgi:hypothetical protein